MHNSPEDTHKIESARARREDIVWALQAPQGGRRAIQTSERGLYLHLAAGGRAQQSHVKVEVGWLLLAALIHCASGCHPDNYLEQVCKRATIHNA